MDAQVVMAVLGTAAGVVSAYYGYLQYKKSSATGLSPTADPQTATVPAPKETKLWSTAVDKAINELKKSRTGCEIEIVQQKNFDKRIERFSTSELVLHVHYPSSYTGRVDEQREPITKRLEMKINKDGDILELESKGARRGNGDKFR